MHDTSKNQKTIEMSIYPDPSIVEPAVRVPFEGLGLDVNDRRVNINAFDGSIISESLYTKRLEIGESISVRSQVPSDAVSAAEGSFDAVPYDLPIDPLQVQYVKFTVTNPATVTVSLEWDGVSELYTYIFRPGADASLLPLGASASLVSAEPYGIIGFDESGVSPINITFTADDIGEHTARIYHVSGGATTWKLTTSYVQTSVPLQIRGAVDNSRSIDITPKDISGYWVNASRRDDEGLVIKKDINGTFYINDGDIYSTPFRPRRFAAFNEANERIPNAWAPAILKPVGHGYELLIGGVETGQNEIWVDLIFTFQLDQTNPDVLWSMLETSVSKRPYPGGIIRNKFVRTNPQRLLENSDPEQMTDYNNPVYMYNAATDICLYSNNPHMQKELYCNTVRDWKSLVAYRDEIRDVGITAVSTVTDVWPTIKSVDAAAQTSIAASSDGVALPVGIIDVLNTSGFTGSGTIRVWTLNGWNDVAYTGITATSFTGCTGGTGDMSTDGVVEQWQVLPAQPIIVWGDVTPFSADFVIYDNNGTAIIEVTDSVSNYYDFGPVIRISGVTKASANGLANEHVNSYWLIVYAEPGFWVGINLVLSVPIQPAQFTDYGVKFECLSYLVNHPSHGMDNGTGGVFDYGFSPLINFRGLTGVGSVPANKLNGLKVNFTWYDSDNYFVMLPPGNDASNDVRSLIDDNGGGSNATVAFISTPDATQAEFLAYYAIQLPFAPVTVPTILLTNINSTVGFASTVQISGFTGVYSVLNGYHPTHSLIHLIYTSNNDHANTYSPDHFNSTTAKYPVAIQFDSSDLPVYSSLLHGVGTVTVVHGPVRADTEYGPLLNSIYHFRTQQSMQTHGVLGVSNTPRGNMASATWNDIREFVGMSLDIRTGIRLRSFTMNSHQNIYFGEDSSDFFNDLPVRAKNSVESSILTVPGAINQSARFNCADTKYRYQITRENYLDKTSLKNMSIMVDPTGGTLEDQVPGSDPNRYHISEYLTALGYNANGLKLTYSAIPLGTGVGNQIIEMTSPVPLFITGRKTASNQSSLPLVNVQFILADPVLANTPLVNAVHCTGKIVVCLLGVNSVATKIANAYAAGAIAVVVINNVGTFTVVDMSVGISTQIPSLSISREIGNTLTGYNGGDPTLTTSYAMPTTGATGYIGTLRNPLAGEINPILGGSAETFYFGRVKASLTPGKNIGYIRVRDTFFYDTYQLMTRNEFTYNVGSESYRENSRRMWVEMLNTDIGGMLMKNMDGFIIEARFNNGGGDELMFTLGEAMGGNRPGMNYSGTALRSNGSTKMEKYREQYATIPPVFMNYSRCIDDSDEYETMDTDSFDAKYPGNLITGKKVVLLWSTRAASGGDVLGHYFVNYGIPDSTDLGNGVTCQIVGNCDGRLFGSASASVYLPTGPSFDIRITPSVSDLVVCPIGLNMENSRARLLAGDVSITNQTPQIAPTDGPLNGEIESDTGLYVSIGLADYPVARTLAPYDTFQAEIGTPDNADPTTWHDPWLEEAILKFFP